MSRQGERDCAQHILISSRTLPYLCSLPSQKWNWDSCPTCGRLLRVWVSTGLIPVLWYKVVFVEWCKGSKVAKWLRCICFGSIVTVLEQWRCHISGTAAIRVDSLHSEEVEDDGVNIPYWSTTCSLQSNEEGGEGIEKNQWWQLPKVTLCARWDLIMILIFVLGET